MNFSNKVTRKYVLKHSENEVLLRAIIILLTSCSHKLC